MILSSHAQHEQRFPPRSDELIPLVNPSDEEEAIEDPQAATEQWSRWAYAHAVATLVDVRHSPPPSATVGAAGVYLDIDSIEHASSDADVLFEGMLGRVIAHELSHVVRGHVSGPPSPVHSWLAEGDAQRDAWQVLTDLLASHDWADLARWGRAAQVRLSTRQPPAYSRFEVSAGERTRLIERSPIEGTTWLARPPRPVHELIKEGEIEVPIVVETDSPTPGDTIYVADLTLVAGPWVVAATAAAPGVSDPVEARGVQRATPIRSGFDPKRPVRWFFLRPVPPLRAGSADAEFYGADLEATALGASAMSRLSARLTDDALDRARTVAAEDQIAMERFAQQRRDLRLRGGSADLEGL